MGTEPELIAELLQRLLAAPEIPFPRQRQPLDAPSEKGVYVLIGPRKVIVHVGSTPRAKGGIAQRLKNHLAGASSFTRQHLNGNGDALRGGYRYKYLVVEDPRHRALLEARAIGVLCPRHLGTG